MTDDEQGLQRAEQLEAALKRELASRAEVHRGWLQAQLAELTAEADKVHRDLVDAAEQRDQRHHELKKLNPEEYRDSEGFTRTTGQDAWLAVAGFFGVTAFLLLGTAQQFPPRQDLLPFVGLSDFLLAFFGFLALTPLWSPAPRPPALMPQLPAFPQVIKELESQALGAGTWRDRLENAQARLRKLTKGDQAPENSGFMQQVLAQARAELRRFIADGRVYLANVERDHFGWQGVAWPAWTNTLRTLGLVLVPGALVSLGALFDGMGLLHGGIALAGGLAGGFFRRSTLSFVEPPEPDEPD